jgi:probable HAF family extracellular repeat protein
MRARVSAGGALPESSPKYTFTILDYPRTLNTNGFGINSGATSSEVELVGGVGNQAASPLGFTGGFLVQYAATNSTTTETYEAVNIAGTTEQSAFGVNDSGEIVGAYADSAAVLHGYLLSGGTFTTMNVPFPTATGTSPFGINNAGEIVGYWLDSTTGHGFLLSSGTYTSFDYPGAAFTIASAINSRGDIVGYYSDTSGVYHGFLLSGGTYTSIDEPGATATEANGINDAGEIVGIYCQTSQCAANFSGFQGFFLKAGEFSDVTIPGAKANGPVGINNKGVIIGVFHDAVGRHGFLATPK